MNNNEQIFESTRQVINDLTSRKFSQLCDKSEGYFGSITAQNIELSTSALVGLAGNIENLKVSLDEADRLKKTKAIEKLLVTIYSAIAERALAESQSKNLVVRRLITEAISTLSYKQSSKYTPLPFSMS